MYPHHTLLLAQLRSFFYAITCASVTWATAAAADEPLSLNEALERAVQVSSDVEARSAERDAAQSLAIQAGRLPDPELIAAIENVPISGPDAGSLNRDFMTMTKIGVMQTFPRGAKRDLRRQRAGDMETVAIVEQQRTTLDVKRQTAQAWIAAYVAEETLARLRTLSGNFELQSSLATAGVKSGRIAVGDALESQTAQLEFNDRILVAEQNVRRARAELTRWLPEDAHRSLSSAPDFTRLSKAGLLENIHDHASLVAYESQLDAARSEVELAQADKRSDWSLGVTYAKRGSEFSDMVSIEFRMGLPFFAGNRQDPVIAAKRADLRRLEASRESELRMHKAEITQLIADWETLVKRRAVFSTDLLPLAKERTQLAIAALQSGRGDVKSALSAQLALVEIQLQALDLEAQLGRTWAALSFLQVERSGT
jgi:outer membrane protein TolC